MEPVTLGVFTDIQYRADKDDYIQRNNQLRSFRSALPKTVEAVAAFSDPLNGVSAIVHLGDIIDGRDGSYDREAAVPEVRAELDAVLRALALRPPSMPIYHVIGNHCLYLGRQEVTKRLGMPQDQPAAYYVRSLSAQWRIVVLDTMDVSVHHQPNTPLRQSADKYLKLHDGEPNAVPWNGGPSSEQLDWLRKTLGEATADGCNVIVCGHHPLVAGAAGPEHVAWYSKEVLDIFQGCRPVPVRAYFAGHYHSGGYVQHEGVHHITFPAVLDSDETNSYAFVHLHTDKLEVQGVGARGPLSRQYCFKV